MKIFFFMGMYERQVLVDTIIHDLPRLRDTDAISRDKNLLRHTPTTPVTNGSQAPLDKSTPLLYVAAGYTSVVSPSGYPAS
jgi:hypothetical protein